MKAAVPVPYIIALIFAVAVIAIVGYWYYSTGGSFQQSLTRAECNNLAIQYCQGRASGLIAESWTEWLDQKGKGACANILGITDENQLCENLGLPIQ